MLCSDDVKAHILREQNCVRLSLYTASHLLFGTTVVFQRQQHYLIGVLFRLHSLCQLIVSALLSYYCCSSRNSGSNRSSY